MNGLMNIYVYVISQFQVNHISFCDNFPIKMIVARVGKYACFCLRVVATNYSFSAATCEKSLFCADMRQN